MCRRRETEDLRLEVSLGHSHRKAQDNTFLAKKWDHGKIPTVVCGVLDRGRRLAKATWGMKMASTEKMEKHVRVGRLWLQCQEGGKYALPVPCCLSELSHLIPVLLWQP